MNLLSHLRLILLLLLTGLFSGGGSLAAGRAPLPGAVSMGQLIQPVIDLHDDDYLLEYFLQEAKRYYADARLMIVARDTLGVQFEVERLVATLAAIEEIDEPMPEEMRETVSG